MVCILNQEKKSRFLNHLPKTPSTKPLPKPLITSADVSVTELDQRKRQEQNEQETAEDIAAANEIIKKAFKQMSAENSELEKAQSTDQQILTRPQSPNSSVNKTLPRNPLGSKILKWNSDQKTHVLTLLRSNGEVKHISRETALDLC